VHEEDLGHEGFRSVICEVKTTASVGEACDQDHEACSIDGAAILRCDLDHEPHAFVPCETCVPPKKCVVHRDPDVIRAACD